MSSLRPLNKKPYTQAELDEVIALLPDELFTIEDIREAVRATKLSVGRNPADLIAPSIQRALVRIGAVREVEHEGRRVWYQKTGHLSPRPPVTVTVSVVIQRRGWKRIAQAIPCPDRLLEVDGILPSLRPLLATAIDEYHRITQRA